MNFQLSSRPVRGLFLLTFFLSLVLLPSQRANAQNIAPPCEAYNPQIPDYIELELCGTSSNNISYSTSDYAGNCAEQISFPEPQQTYVLQGEASTEADGFSSVDYYVFEVANNSEVRFHTTVSHKVTTIMSLYTMTYDWFMCEPTTDYTWFDAHSLYDGTGPCIMEDTFSLDQGYYVMYVIHFPWSGQDLGCDDITYQISMENLASYNDGGSCSFAHEITPKPTFAESQITANLHEGELSNEMGCLQNMDEQRSMWFKFTATHENMFIMAKRNGTSTLNAAVEVYDDCLGEPILCQDAYAGGSNEVVIVNNTVIGQEYYFRVYHNGQGSLSNGNIYAGVAHVPTTTLIPSDCGRTGLLTSSVIRSAWPVNQFLLSNWMFKFQETTPPYTVYEVISPNGTNPNFRMSWFPQVEPGRSYMVWTRPKMYQGPTWGDYGAACVISMAPLVAGMAPDDEGTSGTHNTYAGDAGSLILDVWPNPAQDEMTLRFNADQNDAFVDIRIIDVSGKEVDHIYRTFEGGDIQTLNYTTEKLVTGIYLLQVRTTSGSTVAKLAVNH